ncbi:MAG: hypothetical protein J7K62_01070 [Thermoplasmata archaeon]|nr:hypothetical protein [Thermoplasmata archaeon]
MRKSLILLAAALIITTFSTPSITGAISKVSAIEKTQSKPASEHKICFNCHVTIRGYGHFSALLLFVNMIEGRCSALWLYMWFSNATITVDNWHYKGKCNIHLVGYHGEFLENESTHFFNIDGHATFCLVRGK